MRVTSEKRANQDCEYVRAKRKPSSLPDPWDDYNTVVTKSWKDKRKTQYRGEKRGPKQSIHLNDKAWRILWDLEEYFKKHDIPYRVEKKRKKVIYTVTITTKREKWRQVPLYTHPFRGTVHQIGFRWEYREIPLETPIVKRYKSYESLGYEIVWWSNKDIGIDYIVKDYLASKL